MSRFTDLFQESKSDAEPVTAPEPTKEVVEEKVVPITKTPKKKKFTMN